MISFVYFDVGGVVIDDFSNNNKWQALKHELGINGSNTAAFDKIWNNYALELCVDRDVDSLVTIFAEELGLQLPAGYSLLSGFVDRFYKNTEIWPVIDFLEAKTKLGLLTNMYPRMFTAIQNKGILPETQWEQIIDSSLELLQKPDRKIFELAEKRAGAPHEQILFIDNSLEHIDEADAFGWQTFLYNSADHHMAVQELDAFLRLQEYRNP